ncbi:uncharacterized protein N7483_012433 [Penicillium malachiteum]|uniref:uncharacterized protein n=1 Tax=Penicillium malachiteum TaxID=1324776 RepID=UPI0025486523|nr:uncharacterized protein N7483_012433 [Penicillium malachiteum]KAJ5715252.1 hypothetical protein N7483_012433 [Penicillium malachiteum]
MAMSTAGITNRGTCLLLLTLMVFMTPSHAFKSYGADIFARSDDCPSSYDYCGWDLPSNFCCSSSTSCITTDSETTIICCPSGESCNYISPITCDIQEQNATAHPESSIKTTLLNGTLPTCGEKCCPFGYTCENSLCAMNTNETTQTTTFSGASTATSTSDSTSTSTDASTITSTASSTAAGATFTPVTTSVSTTSINADSTSSKTTTSGSSYPTKAVLAGFFPGAIFGTILALLISTCIRRRTQKKRDLAESEAAKVPRNWSISSPIASEDASYRTDFLLRSTDDRHTSMSSRSMRSMLNRSGSCVRSLFSNGHGYPRDEDVPPLPTQPEFPTTPDMVHDPVTPPRQRAPSTESIKVYSPPGAFMQSRRFLGPEPYPGRIARPSTTFTDLVQAVGFQESKSQAKDGKEEKEEKEPKGNLSNLKESKGSFKVHHVRKIT